MGKAETKARADTVQKHKTQLEAVVCNVVRIGVPLVCFFFSNTCGSNSARTEELAHSIVVGFAAEILPMESDDVEGGKCAKLFTTLRARQSKETEQPLKLVVGMQE